MPSSISNSELAGSVAITTVAGDGGVAIEERFERPGFVRLTASDRPGVAQPVPERDIPPQPWGKILLGALALFVLLMAAWEWHWRAYGATPGYRNSDGAWADQRRRISPGEGGKTVLIGLSGRGGYTRLIGAIEMFTRDLFVGLAIRAEPPLITFGLRTGTPGSLDRFQIDVPFRVVFTPSDWYILLHEVGHLCWVESFGWMTESLATYEALSREIASNRPDLAANDPEKLDKTVRTEFLSTRSIVRELFKKGMQRADHLDRFVQPLIAPGLIDPALAGDVLVQCLTTS